MEIIDEPILDIDSGDQNDPLAVTEYVDDIYAYYKKVEVCNLLKTSLILVQFYLIANLLVSRLLQLNCDANFNCYHVFSRTRSL